MGVSTRGIYAWEIIIFRQGGARRPRGKGCRSGLQTNKFNVIPRGMGWSPDRSPDHTV